jgi:hypothetical protein
MDDKTYRNQVIKLADLVAEDGRLEGFTFVGCHIKGPAVVGLLSGTRVEHCNLGGPNADALLWELPNNRRIVVGAIGAIDCTFEECTFVGIGFTGPPDLIAAFRRDLV